MVCEHSDSVGETQKHTNNHSTPLEALRSGLIKEGFQKPRATIRAWGSRSYTNYSYTNYYVNFEQVVTVSAKTKCTWQWQSVVVNDLICAESAVAPEPRTQYFDPHNMPQNQLY